MCHASVPLPFVMPLISHWVWHNISNVRTLTQMWWCQIGRSSVPPYARTKRYRKACPSPWFRCRLSPLKSLGRHQKLLLRPMAVVICMAKGVLRAVTATGARLPRTTLMQVVTEALRRRTTRVAVILSLVPLPTLLLRHQHLVLRPQPLMVCLLWEQDARRSTPRRLLASQVLSNPRPNLPQRGAQHRSLWPTVRNGQGSSFDGSYWVVRAMTPHFL